MKETEKHNEKVAKLTFASVLYPSSFDEYVFFDQPDQGECSRPAQIDLHPSQYRLTDSDCVLYQQLPVAPNAGH